MKLDQKLRKVHSQVVLPDITPRFSLIFVCRTAILLGFMAFLKFQM